MTSPAPAVRRKRPARIVLGQTMLLLEAFVVLFAALVAFGLRSAPPAAIWSVGGGLAALLLVLAGLQRPRWGSVAGTVAQLPVLACGFVVPMMFGVGGLFAVLWVLFLWLGVRIDAERAVFDAAHPDAVEPARPRRRV
ncbi:MULTISPECIES: DUF4233 domain-containing protein [unclassified Cellulomonas]|uniref:DUF4233 domain-containing protein n=1 Tax=unclassified Cellulomonas TaxID=2620175 RepID=UPI0021E97B3F|nr:DUF4233 domain-containing protein [Cellulomonas sp. SG140]BDO42659.1 hypothetical protein CELD12_21490 [Cellulomonas sp. NTE-D12]